MIQITFQIEYNKLPPNVHKDPASSSRQIQEKLSPARVKKTITLIIYIISGNKIYQELMENRSKSFNFRQIFRNRSKTKDSDSHEKYPKAREEARIEKIEELQEAERRYKLNVKIIEDSQHSKRFSKLTAHKRIKTEPAVDRIESHSTQPIKKEGNAVSIKKIDFYDNNQVQELNRRLNTLISEKLTKLSKMLKYQQPDSGTRQGDSNFYNDLNDLIRNIKRIKNKEGSNEISFLNKKIEYIESLMAENTTELDLIKKYYYYCNSNKKRSGLGRFMSEGPRIFKAIRANQINRTSPLFSESLSPKNRPFFGVASNKEQYKAPKKEFYQLERTKEQSYSFNDQPLPRSSYKRDFLNVNAIPIESTKVKEDRHHSPNYTTTFKSRYTLDFQPLKTETFDYKELDAYQDKLKFLQISYPNPQSVPLKSQPKVFPSLSKEPESPQLLKLNASVCKQERCFDKHRFVTESQKSYGWQMLNDRSRIKHKQLREFQYRLKSLFKS